MVKHQNSLSRKEWSGFSILGDAAGYGLEQPSLIDPLLGERSELDDQRSHPTLPILWFYDSPRRCFQCPDHFLWIKSCSYDSTYTLLSWSTHENSDISLYNDRQGLEEIMMVKQLEMLSGNVWLGVNVIPAWRYLRFPSQITVHISFFFPLIMSEMPLIG